MIRDVQLLQVKMLKRKHLDQIEAIIRLADLSASHKAIGYIVEPHGHRTRTYIVNQSGRLYQVAGSYYRSFIVQQMRDRSQYAVESYLDAIPQIFLD